MSTQTLVTEGTEGCELIDVYARAHETSIREQPSVPLGTLSSSERDALGLLDCIGPTDARGLALAMHCPIGFAHAVLVRLVASGLVVTLWSGGIRRSPWYALSPATAEARND